MAICFLFRQMPFNKKTAAAAKGKQSSKRASAVTQRRGASAGRWPTATEGVVPLQEVRQEAALEASGEGSSRHHVDDDKVVKEAEKRWKAAERQRKCRAAKVAIKAVAAADGDATLNMGTPPRKAVKAVPVMRAPLKAKALQLQGQEHLRSTQRQYTCSLCAKTYKYGAILELCPHKSIQIEPEQGFCVQCVKARRLSLLCPVGCQVVTHYRTTGLQCGATESSNVIYKSQINYSLCLAFFSGGASSRL